jgi:glycerol uptake facilitator-like aquaporin
MEEFHSGMLFYVMVAWGAITATLAVLVIYRSTLSSREDDQLFIDAAEEHMAAEQRELVSRSKRLTRPIVTLAVLSAALLLTVAGVWLYQGFKSF